MIYIITRRTPNYHICAVATTREYAEELQEMYNDATGYEDDEAEIEEFVENVPYDKDSFLRLWKVIFGENGSLYEITHYYGRSAGPQVSAHSSFITVFDIAGVEDGLEALKIAREKLAEYREKRNLK